MLKIPIFFILFCIFLLLEVKCQNFDENFKFDKNLVGIAFQPYVKEEHVPWTNYTLDEVKNMLRHISQKFTLISTYGMGASGGINLNENEWDKVEGNCHIAKGAAEINLEKNSTVLKIAQAMWHNEQNDIFQNIEIKNAIRASKISNKIWPGTVWGLIFTTVYFYEPERAFKLVNLIQKYKSEVQEMKLKIGTRFDSCHEILKIDQNILENKFKPLIKEVDFIFCSFFPDYSIFTRTFDMSFIVQDIWNKFANIKILLKNINPNIQVTLGEIGWPSFGRDAISDNQTYNIQNLVKFWIQMVNKSREQNQSLYLFEAFNEPWKPGIGGTEKNFGWWKMENNQIIEKIYEKDLGPEDLNSESDKNAKAKDSYTIIVITILGAIILFGVIMILVWKLRKSKIKYNELTDKDIKDFQEGISNAYEGFSINYGYETETALFKPYDKSKEIPKNKIQIDKNSILGAGAFGIVFKGEIDGVGQVAFKTIREDAGVEYLKGLLAEIKIMIYIGEHPNIIKFLGSYTAEIRKNIIYVASELCENGNLEKHLRTELRINFSDYDNNLFSKENGIKMTNIQKEQTRLITQLFKWSYQISNAMDFLGSKNIIHSDLATRNCLLDDEKNIKITDFGLSRRLYEYTDYIKTNNHEPLPWRWMSIESLRNLEFSTKSDVWSFGITLWEIFSLGDIPYPGLNYTLDFVDKLEKENLRNIKPKFATDEIYSVMINCWSKVSTERPQFPKLSQDFYECYMNYSNIEYSIISE